MATHASAFASEIVFQRHLRHFLVTLKKIKNNKQKGTTRLDYTSPQGQLSIGFYDTQIRRINLGGKWVQSNLVSV